MAKTTLRKSSFDSGAASEFLVLSSLFRQGANAFISLGNKKSIDIAIKAKNGKAISVDVKSVRGYSSIVVNNVLIQVNHFIVIVIYKGKFVDPLYIPDFYIVPSNVVTNLQSTFGTEKRLMVGKLLKYKDNWTPLLI